ncbi:hypothetical protein HY256_01805, partial [Candidatus Sumerlaeota bacterium]|nr:hypothetical protein [Candidatus Sumerlaeota bacterium]
AANGAIYLTTPVAYITSLLTDPFAPPGTVLPSGGGAVGYRIASGAWSYSNPPINTSDNQGSHLVFPETGPIQAWAVIAVGPDGGRCRMGYKCFPFEPVNDPKEGPPSTNVNSKGQPFCWTEYDPTNGTTSVGDVYRFGGSYQEGRFMLNGAAVGRDTSPGPDAF